MKLTRTQAKRLESAITEWESNSLITTDTASKLRGSFQIVGFDWKRLAKYSFWSSVICVAIAVAAIIDDKLIEPILTTIFGSVQRGYFALFGVLASALFYLGVYRKRSEPTRIFSNEAIFLLGVLSIAASIAFLGVDLSHEHPSLLLLLAAIIYSVLGLWLPSKLVWIFALLSLGSWFGAETGYLSGGGAYYLGMNYPVRFVFFGALLAGASYVFTQIDWRRDFYVSTRVMGMLYLFIALWMLSIFGNYGDLESWYTVKQHELFHWSLIFGLVSIGAIYLGIRYEDKVARGFGLTFLFINLYTRFFEFFWDHLHKAIFFAILAVSFWYLGSRAERIWSIGANLERRENREAKNWLSGRNYVLIKLVLLFSLIVITALVISNIYLDKTNNVAKVSNNDVSDETEPEQSSSPNKQRPVKVMREPIGLYAEPSENARRVGKIYKKSSLIVTDENDEWIQVRIDNGGGTDSDSEQTGWIMKDWTVSK